MHENITAPKVAFIGSRGIPAKYGGFETFVEELSSGLSSRHGFDVTVVCDSEKAGYNNNLKELDGINLRYSRFSKSANALLFYIDSLIMCRRGYDLVYACGPAAGLFGLIVRMSGTPLLINPDGLNMRRAKWSPAVRTAFRVMDFMSARIASHLFCDSKGISSWFENTYGASRHIYVIEYGAHVNKFLDQVNATQDEVLDSYGVRPGMYHLVIARLEPENNVDKIIRGYMEGSRKFPLIVVGDLKSTAYVRELESLSGESVIFTGGVYEGDNLSILRAKALDYFHGHSVGGTNPSLLEAMASRNLCVCHDNGFNREVVGENGLFFKSVEDVSALIGEIESGDNDTYVRMRQGALERVISYYNWESICRRYADAFREIVLQVTHGS